MKDIQPINEFLKCSTFALVGVSRNEKKFGNYVFKEMKKRNFKVLPISSYMNTYEGEKCCSNVASVAKKADAIITIVHKDRTMTVIKDANESGIKNIWVQQGTETPEVISYCIDNEINLVHGECILMYVAGNKFPHNFHKLLWRTLGLFPK